METRRKQEDPYHHDDETTKDITDGSVGEQWLGCFEGLDNQIWHQNQT